MRPHHGMAVLLTFLVGVTAVTSWTATDANQSASAGIGVGWLAFLYVLPLTLAGFLLAGQRWAFMAGVMYGTIGLALDLSTVVQEITHGPPQVAVLISSAGTGLLNFLLILLGGRGFLSPPALTPR